MLTFFFQQGDDGDDDGGKNVAICVTVAASVICASVSVSN